MPSVNLLGLAMVGHRVKADVDTVWREVDDEKSVVFFKREHLKLLHKTSISFTFHIA